MVKSLPIIIRSLSVLGTLALLLVAGGIFVHHIDFFHHILASLPAMLQEFLIGLAVGSLVLLVIIWFKKSREMLFSK